MDTLLPTVLLTGRTWGPVRVVILPLAETPYDWFELPGKRQTVLWDLGSGKDLVTHILDTHQPPLAESDTAPESRIRVRTDLEP